ncbi:G-protein coupled receptor Mth2-like isoform X5 [Cotesia glomerata]|uniref:G-protein coupled receptor Mth2-like isoform X5 n=1 Tax=Cotesia glomerata TaxID=32391 RepID=UPI001D022951|nr:G-protein coupled receptor Mth2-like isoform X5 [Cotesia glomerata]
MLFTSSTHGFFIIIFALLSPNFLLSVTVSSDVSYNVSELYNSFSTVGIDSPDVNDELITNTSIPICCPPGFVVNSSKCIKSSIPEHAINITNGLEYLLLYTENYTESETKWDSLEKKYGIPCQSQLAALNPEYPNFDVFYLLENGTLYINYSLDGDPDQLLNADQFCIAHIERDDQISIVVAICSSFEEVNIPFTYRMGILLSIPFFAMTFLVYALLPQLRNIPGLNLMAYVGSTFVAYVTLAIVQIGECAIIDMTNLCITFAFVIHFSFLASFFWLNVMCFDIWWTFGKNPGLYTNPYGGFRALQGSQKKQERKKFACYSIYAWGCAGLLTGICLIMDFHPNISSSVIRPQFGKESCWFATDAARAIYFYGPMGVTVVCNIILFIATAMKIVHHKKETAHLNRDDNRRHNDNKQWFNLYLKLFIVMGVNWSMEIISWIFGNKPDYIWYVTDVANTLQGLVIFIIFVWKRKIKILLLKRFGCKDSKFLQSRNSTRSTHNSSMSTKTNTSILNPLPDKFKMTTIERNQDENTEVF